MLQTLTDGWATFLSDLYYSTAIAVLSAFENFFPPFPSDAVIAFGSFLADRAHGSPFIVFLLGWLGNVSGAGGHVLLGRSSGAKVFLRRIEKYAGPDPKTGSRSSTRSTASPGWFVSRFLPGVRAIVPPFAGAMRLPAFKPVMFSVASASAVWFG